MLIGKNVKDIRCSTKTWNTYTSTNNRLIYLQGTSAMVYPIEILIRVHTVWTRKLGEIKWNQMYKH